MPKILHSTVIVLLLLLGSSLARADDPVLCFSDLASGPRNGNSDTSLGQIAGHDGAILTLWGKNLGNVQGDSSVTIGGANARIYSWGPATAPADLHSRLGMQMICAQVSGSAQDGPGEIVVMVRQKRSNALPFTVQEGRIFLVKTAGDDSAAGDWEHPWRTLPHAVGKLSPGDTVYVCDGVRQVVEDSFDAALNLPRDGAPGKPKALVAYPGAKCVVGNDQIRRGFGRWASGLDRSSDYWTISKFIVTSHESSILLGSGFRVVGNLVTAPTGSAPEGAIEGSGNDLVVVGNELTHVGRAGCSKLYHPIYISTFRASSGPRHPTESNREIAWNYVHDNNANRGINIYSEQSSTAYMTGHRVHDNFIVNQVGDAMLIGHDVVGENWIYNNVIAHAGLGPDPDPRESGFITHFGVHIDAGDEGVPGTVIHFDHNTLYDCGWPQSPQRGATGMIHFANVRRYTLDFRNNIICSTGQAYVSGWSEDVAPPALEGHNLWFGAGKPPAWDRAPLTGDPRFVNPALDDFRLRPNSPATFPSNP